MLEDLTSYDEEEDGKNVHHINGMQVYTIERAYVTKEELKQRKKANKMKMTMQNIKQFERQHNIPPLPASGRGFLLGNLSILRPWKTRMKNMCACVHFRTNSDLSRRFPSP